MPAQQVSQHLQIYYLFLDKAKNSFSIFGPPDLQRGRDDMFRRKRGNLDPRRFAIKLNFDFHSLVQCLRIKFVRDRKKLNRPTFNDDALFFEFLVPSIAQILNQRRQRVELAVSAFEIVKRDQYIQVLGKRRLNIIERRHRSRYRIFLNDPISDHAIDYLESAFQAGHIFRGAFRRAWY